MYCLLDRNVMKAAVLVDVYCVVGACVLIMAVSGGVFWN